MKIRYVMVPLLALALTVGCKHVPEAAEEPLPEVAAESEMSVADEPGAPVERVPVLQKAKPTPKRTVAQPAAKPQSANPREQQTLPPVKGTIYVETDGAQGRVWGHVNMNGDKGTGTIHDWDENTWAVSVTRHGDELFAVDQNSRLYVFKLKK